MLFKKEIHIYHYRDSIHLSTYFFNRLVDSTHIVKNQVIRIDYPDEVWPGTDLLIADLSDFVRVIHAANPGRPITLVGESMGAAVVLLVLSRHRLPAVINGVVLIAPAVIPNERP